MTGPSLLGAQAANQTCVPGDDANNGGHICVSRADYGPYGNDLRVTAGTPSSGFFASAGCNYPYRTEFPRGVYVGAGAIGGGYTYVDTSTLGPEASPAISDVACPVIDAVEDTAFGAG